MKLKFGKKNNFLNKGFSLIEALLSISIFSLLITVFVGSIIYGQESERLANDRARATFIAEEGLEAVRNIRDAGFENLVAGTYGLSISGNQWNFSGSSDTVEIFNRSVNISDLDEKTKLVKSTVEWQQNNQRSGIVSLETRMTNWRKIRLTDAEQLEIHSQGELKKTSYREEFLHVEQMETSYTQPIL